MRPRVGHIQFLNCLPLYHMLVRNGAVFDIDLFKDTPIALCSRLLQGELDISPIPAIEYARNAGEVLLLPDLAVSSRGPVKSIVIISKVPLDSLDDKPLALSNTSRTSQVLARILLAGKFGLAPRFFECPPDLPEMFREADAAMLIGDDALRAYANPGGCYVYDLGEQWEAYRRAPMVYAVWAVRKEFAERRPGLVARVREAFRRSRDMSIEHIDAISVDIARWEPFSPEFLAGYFNSLKYDFSADYRQGLSDFFMLAQEAGAIEKAPELCFVKER